MADYVGHPLRPGVSNIVPAITIHDQGWDLSGVSYTDSTKTLTKTGAWAGYTPNAAYTGCTEDTVLIASNSTGNPVVVGRYSIVSKTDNTLVLRTSPTAGAGDSGGLVLVSGGEVPYPCSISFEGTTWDGTADLEDFEFTVDFGDGSSAEVVTDWHDIISQPQVNTNNCWTTPKAFHVYRTPGTYEISVTCRVRTALPSTYAVSSEATQTVVVHAWLGPESRTKLFDNTAGKTGDDIQPFLASVGKLNCRVILKDDEVFTIGSTYQLVDSFYGRVRFERSGDGTNKPIIKTTSANPLISGQLSLINVAFSDVVFDGIVFDEDAKHAQIIYFYNSSNGSGGYTWMRDWSWLECEFKGGAGGDQVVINSADRAARINFHRCSFDGLSVVGNVLYTAVDYDLNVVGCNFVGGSWVSGQEKHFIYPNGNGTKWANWLFAYNYFGPTTLRYAINANLNSDTGDGSGYYCVGNFVDEMPWGFDFNNTNNDPARGQLDSVVVRGNMFKELTVGGGFTANGAKKLTASFNRSVVSSLYRDISVTPSENTLKFFGNELYLTSAAGFVGVAVQLLDDSPASGLFVDNAIYSTAASGYLMYHRAGTDSIWTVDRNTWYMPNVASPFYDSVAAAAKNFAGWQALGYDTNGSVADPGWNDPANGDFSTIAAPTVTTAAASSITATSATAGGNVTDDGGAAVTARGVCWSTTDSTPTLDSCDGFTEDGTGTGAFTSTLGPLPGGTLIYHNAYATNSVGSLYGTADDFTTLAGDPATGASISADGESLVLTYHREGNWPADMTVFSTAVCRISVDGIEYQAEVGGLAEVSGETLTVTMYLPIIVYQGQTVLVDSIEAGLAYSEDNSETIRTAAFTEGTIVTNDSGIVIGTYGQNGPDRDATSGAYGTHGNYLNRSRGSH